MLLKNKLFLLVLSLATFILISSGYIYYNNLNQIFDKHQKQNIERDNYYLKQFVLDIKNTIKDYSVNIANNQDIQSSLNLIVNYEDPKDYVKDIFDFEKINLIKSLQQLIKEKNNYSFGIFNQKGELILLDRKHQTLKETGYISYNSNGDKIFINHLTNKEENIPYYTLSTKDTINKLESNYFENSYFIKYVNPIVIDGNIIGYIRVALNINSNHLNDLNNKLETQMVFNIENEGLILQENMSILDFNKIKNSDNYKIEKYKLIDLNIDLETLFIIDKTDINNQVDSIFMEILIIWFFILIVVFIFSFIFVQKLILNPVENLKKAIKGIKNNNFSNIEIKSNDEIGDISKDFNNLSRNLKNNISFLNSHKNIIDEGNIVTKSDLEGNITYANDNFLKVSGYTMDEVIGRQHSLVRDNNTPKDLFKNLWETIQSKKVWKGVLKNIKKDGGYYWVDITIQPILDSNNEIIEYMAIRHDITELIDQREKLNKIAYTDNMTGLGNRVKLTKDLKENNRVSLAILNIDNFRHINDFYGHDFGDKLIVKVSKIINNIIRLETNCSLYHLKGDEFALTNSKYDPETFEGKIKNILNFISHDNIELNNEQISLKMTASISFETNDKIFQTADMALKIARKQHLESIVYNDKISLNKEYENNIKWTKKIKSAISEDRVIPFFQPIVNNKDNKYEKYEALVRIKDDDGKIISPFFFLDIAKQTKHYNTITKIMLKKSFEYFKNKPFEFSVNLTVDDILDDEIEEYIFHILSSYNIGNRVVFEIVESESIENFKAVSSFIEKVKSFGCKIAIDDFGTGYSNFEYLIKLKADYIKIDGSMIKNIDTNKDAKVVVSAIVDFANKLNIKTIAEFVENEKILN
ncbi:MAG: EAL domain-containing protein, partial [Campylobacterota bacterium]|nr:EAL domain-containing protein [Campylobacterota bacterium]